MPFQKEGFDAGHESQSDKPPIYLHPCLRASPSVSLDLINDTVTSEMIEVQFPQTLELPACPC